MTMLRVTGAVDTRGTLAARTEALMGSPPPPPSEIATLPGTLASVRFWAPVCAALSVSGWLPIFDVGAGASAAAIDAVRVD